MARTAAHSLWSARSALCQRANSELTETTRLTDRDTIEHLRDEGLIRTIALDEHHQAVVLTDEGRDLSLTVASWNQVAGWLRRLERLRRAG